MIPPGLAEAMATTLAATMIQAMGLLEILGAATNMARPTPATDPATITTLTAAIPHMVVTTDPTATNIPLQTPGLVMAPTNTATLIVTAIPPPIPMEAAVDSPIALEVANSAPETTDMVAPITMVVLARMTMTTTRLHAEMIIIIMDLPTLADMEATNLGTSMVLQADTAKATLRDGLEMTRTDLLEGSMTTLRGDLAMPHMVPLVDMETMNPRVDIPGGPLLISAALV